MLFVSSLLFALLLLGFLLMALVFVLPKSENIVPNELFDHGVWNGLASRARSMSDQWNVNQAASSAAQQQGVSSGVALGQLSTNAAGRVQMASQLLQSNLIDTHAALKFLESDFNDTTLNTGATSEVTELQRMVKELMARVEYLEDKLGLND